MKPTNPTQEKPTAKITDAVFKQYGPPFIVNGKKVALNSRAVAEACSTIHTVKYNTGTKAYERYDSERGQWCVVNEVAVARKLDNLLVKLGEEYDVGEFVMGISASKLSSLCKMMRPHDVSVQKVSAEGLIHASNGVVDLSTDKPKLMPHEAKYPFHNTSGIEYDAKASCPKFLKQLLGTALAPADIALLQKYCGSMLLGPNNCHGILIIRGTAGGGKSTLLSIVEKVFGETYVAHLRTGHLGSRFETSAFLGKRLLVGKDVPGDTLAASGARMLKSLVGDDLVQAEVKYNPEKKALRGNFHVVIVSNNNLHIALDGDKEAWGRRLLVVDFTNPKPAKPIPNFAEQLVAQEGSGILNWLIEGAVAYRNEMKKHGHLQLNDVQQGRVATLLEDSDSVTQFVSKAIVQQVGSDVTCEELLLCYYRQCERQKWTPVASQTFYTRVPDLLGQKFKTARRNDIVRNGRAVRGFKNITLA